MSDRISSNPQPEQEPYTPASPVKRAIAWIGVVYMVILVALTTYMYFDGGVALTGIAPLLAIPGLVGLGIVVGIKAGLKAPLIAILGNAGIANAVRYGLMVVFAGAVWPLTFKFWGKCGKK